MICGLTEYGTLKIWHWTIRSIQQVLAQITLWERNELSVWKVWEIQSEEKQLIDSYQLSEYLLHITKD